ncbi:hypothetical protein [Salmonella enterica]|uniref:hypothetical protein n=1 Tax=Salmonella enterica TaxID=28901 RepID=UPI0030ACEA9B
MKEYLQDNDAFGDSDETELISEVFEGFKPILMENKNNDIPISVLQEHSNGLYNVTKDIFEDFILYALADG